MRSVHGVNPIHSVGWLVVLAAGALLAGASALPADQEGASPEGSLRQATFAGGCFWCMEPAFERLECVVEVVSGYSGGDEDDPTYREVSSGRTGHAEVVQVTFDPARISYEELLAVFWRNIDPTTRDRQFCDRGSQYRSAIFFHDEAQREAAERSLRELERRSAFPEPVVTEILPFTRLFVAEDYHQDYYKKNPERYRQYREGCRRDQRLRELWGDEAEH